MRTSLHELGVCVQLGHPNGRACHTNAATNSTFRVIHSNGIHHINVDYCQCNNSNIKDQLMAIGWWPATPIVPKTAATFEVLKHFHILNLQGKVTGYSFYHTLEYQTDNTGLELPPISIHLHVPSAVTEHYIWPGSLRIVHAHSLRMAPHEDVTPVKGYCWGGLRAPLPFISSAVPCVSPAKYQLAQGLG